MLAREIAINLHSSGYDPYGGLPPLPIWARRGVGLALDDTPKACTNCHQDELAVNVYLDYHLMSVRLITICPTCGTAAEIP